METEVRKKKVTDALKGLGYSVSVDSDGDILINIDNKKYLIMFEPDDDEFYLTGFAYFWPIDSEVEKERALIAANYSNLVSKWCKVFVVAEKKNVYSTVELLFKSTDEYCRSFERIVKAINNGVKLFSEKMNELQSSGK